MNSIKRTSQGVYKNDAWTIQRSGRMGVMFWFAYRTGSLTKNVWSDPTAKTFLTLREAKQFVSVN